MIAHRGAHREGIPENSLAAFERAVELGADMIELDVRRTADAELIVFHDFDCGGVPVSQLTVAELSQRSGIEPQRLSAVLAWARGRIALDVELKEDGYLELVASMLTEFSGSGGELLVTSFLDGVVERLPQQLARGLLVGDNARDPVKRARACRADALVVQMQLADATLEATVDAGLRFFAWDFLASDDAALLRDPRVEGVITDDVPGALIAR